MMRDVKLLLFACCFASGPLMSQHVVPTKLDSIATVRDTSPNAFGYPAPVLSRMERRTFLVGNSFFKQNWIEAPASASERDGLGPLFNARSCSSCHFKDGRSAPPAEGAPDRHGLLIRVGVRRPDGPDRPHPNYGGQIQDRGAQGVDAEARVRICYEQVDGTYEDGSRYSLLRPDYALTELAYGELGETATLGPRVAPSVIGLGLLEAVTVRELERRADPRDADGDGISGRVHYLDRERKVVGRFGWKATQPTVRSQTAAAFVNDMGITSIVEPREALTERQRQRIVVDESALEIRTSSFEKVVFYTLALAVPAQRNAGSPEVRRGRELFSAFGCATCHAPTLTTGPEAFVATYANQRFHPFTDLLLHDLGPDLADAKRDGDAEPGEWRTPPLWGIGLLETVNGHTRLLHDGRARGVAEAVLWHGGEARLAREFFRRAPATDRDALVAFVESL